MKIKTTTLTETWVGITSNIVMEVFCKTKYNYFYRPVGEPKLEMYLNRRQFEKEFISQSSIERINASIKKEGPVVKTRLL